MTAAPLDDPTPPSPPPKPARPSDRWRRRVRGVRSALSRWRVSRWALLAIPTLLVLAMDLSARPAKVQSFGGSARFVYIASCIVSAGLWAGLLGAAARRGGLRRHASHLLLVLVAIIAVGAQVYTFARYHAYMNHRAVLVGTSMLPSIGQQLWSDRGGFARALLPPAAVALFLPLALRFLRPTRRRRTGLYLDVATLCLLVSLLVSPSRGAEQGTLPDVMYLSAMGQLGRARWNHNETVERLHPGPRTPAPLPPLHAAPPRKRNVLFVLNESVRAKSSCIAFTPDCASTPFSNAAAPLRFPLLQMRTVDSTTAISLLVMWSGNAPEVSRDQAHRAPLIWEYAAAAGLDTAYWTSQNMLFGNSGRWLESMHFTRGAHAAELEESPPLETGADDARLVDRVLADVPQLKQPFVGVVHLSNTHFPYRIDPADAPFQPEGEDPSFSHRVEILNRYRDAIYHQDRSIARLIQEVRKLAPDTVVVYASDHGEQMFEKGSHSHTGTLFEPEVHIPAWVDAPAGTLTDAEAAGLARAKDAPVTSLDLFPTFMDLLGLWDAAELRPFLREVPGESLLRGGGSPDVPHVMSNCTGLWACAFRNWGAIAGRRKLVATQSDQDWLCFDVVADPEEEHALPKAACADLVPVAETLGRPF